MGNKNLNIATSSCTDRTCPVQREKSELKRKRSSVLHQMTIMGIDTSDWKRVNELCLNRRIAGKVFHKLSYEELNLVLIKLRIINRKRLKK
jgi:hypothetical protein